ncbi:protein kinase [Reyranella sp.]|uniref:protein kinase domain-containing protein n=1 Tax=Reyranella sp. TaxID=1929291 RepID=UPI0027281BBB|nr:protein kinase [Reyranella sp.]MDO8973004.1 protein kinase [Reyranella sp.]
MVDMRSETTAAAPEVDIVALPVGAQIGRYEVLSVLGQGGFGITYRARDVQLDREVAIKEYLPTALAVRQGGITVMPRSTKVAEDFTWGRDRFVAEGRVMATLHRAPGIVRVFDFLEINGTAYIVMEMLHGDTLEGHIKKNGRLNPQAIDRILWPLLDGLEQVHNAGFLHRDIKPANILLDAAGNPTLIDFGASRAAMVGRTVAMTAIFTPGYAAAEQFTSAKQGPWTDIYGVSATLYHAITGTSPPSAFERMLDDAYEPVAKDAPVGFAPGLLAGIDAGLAVRATDRPQSIAGWRLILSLTAAPGDALTVAARSRPDPTVTTVAKVPRPIAAPVQATSPAPSAPPTPAQAPLAASAVVEPMVPIPAAPAESTKSRTALYAGAAVAALILAGGGSYFMFGSKPSSQIATTPQGVAVQDLKIEDLERALAERRAADAAAAEKKRLEDAAQKKATEEAASKQVADVELDKAQQQRRKAEEELAKLKAEIEARRQEQQNQAMRADAEAAQRKAETEMAALRQAEDDAQKKAMAEADAKRLADEALVKAQAERQKADAEAKQKADAEARQKAEASTKELAEAEARQKAEADAKQKADAEAQQKADADAAAAAAATDKKAAEATEVALRLTPPDRQRIQVALTSLGFDTRGNDGAFGPRSREMITGWQKARNQPVTGFLTGTQHQTLLREAAPAVTRYNDEQKKIEDEKKKADEEAKAKMAASAPAVTLPPAAISAPPAAITPTAAPAGAAQWTGSAKCDYWPGPIKLTVPVTGGQGSATATGPGGNGTTVTVNISGNSYSGSINGRLRGGNQKILVGSFSGALSGPQIRTQATLRADFRSDQGPNQSSCTIELDRAG